MRSHARPHHVHTFAVTWRNGQTTDTAVNGSRRTGRQIGLGDWSAGWIAAGRCSNVNRIGVELKIRSPRHYADLKHSGRVSDATATGDGRDGVDVINTFSRIRRSFRVVPRAVREVEVRICSRSGGFSEASSIPGTSTNKAQVRERFHILGPFHQRIYCPESPGSRAIRLNVLAIWGSGTQMARGLAVGARQRYLSCTIARAPGRIRTSTPTFAKDAFHPCPFPTESALLPGTFTHRAIC